MKPLTKEQGAVLSAFTGIMCCEFSDFHEYVEKIMGRSVWTHELADKAVREEIKEASRADFMELIGVEK